MRVFHNSRQAAYRSPYGALELGKSVKLAVDVADMQPAEVLLRTWIDEVGEARYAMSPDPDVAGRYQIVFTPDAAGVVWYHFIVRYPDGGEKRYGARDGLRGGEGELRDWEPPSFQLTVYDADNSAAPVGEASLVDDVIDYLTGLSPAPALVETVQELRENVPPATFKKTLDELAGYDHAQLYARIAAEDPNPAKGRLWCASLIQSLLVGGACEAIGDPDLLPGSRYDADCEAIAENARDLGRTLKGTTRIDELFAANDDVIGFWRRDDNPAGEGAHAGGEGSACDGAAPRGDAPVEGGESEGDEVAAGNSATFASPAGSPAGSPADPALPAAPATCVLLNASLYNAHDVEIPLPDGAEAVSEVISGYAVPLSDDGASARPHLYQLGSAILSFHAHERLQRPMEPGIGVLAHITSLPTGIPANGEGSASEPRDAKAAAPIADAQDSPAGESANPGAATPDSAASQPAAQALGTLGTSARAFVDWLAARDMRYWQVLPVNPTDEHGSPYAGISAFAGNTRLLEAEEASAPDAAGTPHAAAVPASAASAAPAPSTPSPEAPAAIPEDERRYRAFCEREADWLEPYVSFMAIRRKVGKGKTWQEWPKKYRRFDPALISADDMLRAFAEDERRSQYAFERQWRELRAYANERGVRIIGDMPIYVSPDSSDVWAHPEIFQLGSDGRPVEVAGCPPDAFAVDGQIWGNPVYDWDALRESGFAWWLRRLERAFELYDVVRLDHFIGFARYYSIPNGAKATEGRYHPGPGIELFERAFEQFGPLPIIAEDLGLITPAVRALVATCGFPGMDIVQFVDGGDPLSGYRPRPEKVAYTGTHDNQTLVGYAAQRYPHLDAHATAAELVDKVLESDAPVRIAALQDLLGLGDEARMNTPGTVENNWAWQATSADLA